jgi:hypothetical protein
VQRDRRINRRQQGDLGEASAVEWLLSKNAVVLVPFGHSPDYDLAAQVGDQLLRVQVKTSTQVSMGPDGHRRSSVALATSGGNRSWDGTRKLIDPTRFDYLYVHTGGGRRWFIPAAALDGHSSIVLGGPKYCEYEIEPGRPITELVYGDTPSIESTARPGGVSKRSTDGDCKSSGSAFAGSNPASPISTARPVEPTKYERKLGQSGQAVINQKRRITIPQRAFFEAGLENGGRVRVRADGPGRVVLEQIGLPVWARSDDSGAKRPCR